MFTELVDAVIEAVARRRLVFERKRIGRWESGKRAFGFHFPVRPRRRSCENVGVAKRFPRTLESDVCFPSVRHFHSSAPAVREIGGSGRSLFSQLQCRCVLSGMELPRQSD
jgi:hypothetical protein